MSKINKIRIFKKIVIISILIIIILVSLLSIKRRKKEEEALKNETFTNIDKYENKDLSEEKSAKIKVYVCGEVKTPGVYECSETDRVIDCINMAGAFTDKADVNAINLAMKVEDATKIYVPSLDEKNEEKAIKKVNINTATKEVLSNVSGIGKNRAAQIVEYRNKKGLFKRLEDLMKVQGIKEATFNKIKDKITI